MNRKSILEKYWLNKIRKGDTDTFAKLYDDLAPRIYRFVLFKVDSVEEAEDITSQTFLKVWHYVREGTTEVKSLRAFVYRVTRNLIIDYYRARAQSPYESLPSADGESPPALRDETMGRHLELASDLALLYTTLQQLKDEYREILVLKYIDELTTGEICEILTKNAGAVRTQLSRALRALRELLPEGIQFNERTGIHNTSRETQGHKAL